MDKALIPLLPELVLMVSAGLFFLSGLRRSGGRWWGPLCLGALLGAAAALGYSWRTDPPAELTAIFQAVLLAVGFLLAAAALDASPGRPLAAFRFGSLLLGLGGTMITIVADEVASLLVGLASVDVATCCLVFLGGNPRRTNGPGVRWAVLNLLPMLMVFLGVAYLYGLTGETTLEGIRLVLETSYSPLEGSQAVGAVSRLSTLAVLLVFAGAGFRLCVVPFHFGGPDVYDATESWNAGFVAVVPKLAALVVLVRLLVVPWLGLPTTASLLALVVAAATMTVGGAQALVQTKVRPLMGYMFMAHGGFVLAGLAAGFWQSMRPEQRLADVAGFPEALAAAAFYFVTYAFAAVGLASILVYLSGKEHEIEFVEDLRGLYRWEPAAAVCSLVLLLSLLGVPPLAGFWSRLIVLANVLSVQADWAEGAAFAMNEGFILLAVVGVGSLLMLAAVSIRLAIVMILRGPAGQPRPGGGQTALAAAVLAALVTLSVGLLPGPALAYLDRVAGAVEVGGVDGK